MTINNKIAKYEELNKPRFKKVPGDSAVRNKNGTISSYETMESKLKKLSNLQKKTEELFKKSEEYYKSFFENSIDGIYKSTLDGNYIDANPALVKMLGYDNKEELFSMNIPEQLYVSKKYRPSPNEEINYLKLNLRKKMEL